MVIVMGIYVGMKCYKVRIVSTMTNLLVKRVKREHMSLEGLGAFERLV